MFFIFFDATVFIVLFIIYILCGLAGLTALIELIVKLRFVILFLLFIVGLIIAKKSKFLFCKIIIVIQTLLICYTVDNMCLNFHTAVDMELFSAICIALFCVALMGNLHCIIKLYECEEVDGSIVIASIVGTICATILACISSFEFSSVIIIALVFYSPLFLLGLEFMD